MRVLCIVALALAFAGCGAPDSGAEASVPSESSGAEASVPSESPASADTSRKSEAATPTNISLADTPAPRAVVRTASLGVRVTDLEKSEREVARLVASMGGYIESAESTDLAGQHPNLAVSLRVPESSFEEALRSFEALGTRLSKHIEAKDVTAQIADHGARLQTMRVHEQALREMLRGARDSNSIYEAQRRLAEVRGEIEGLGAQLKAMQGLASLSTIHLNLEQSAEAMPAADPRWAAEAWAAASTSASQAFRAAAGLAMWFVAYSPLLAIGYVVWRLFARRRTDRGATASL